jgi:L-alanine-DL-glutamate epimerase-like enolase superfamily enzyme
MTHQPMRITAARSWIVQMPLSEPYTIAYDRVSRASNVLLRLDTDHGLVGYGVGCPETLLTQETAETVQAGLQELIPELIGQAPLERARIVREIRASFPGRPALRASVDLALHDLLGKVTHHATWELLGGFRREIQTCATIGILDAPATLARAELLASQGFRTLKLKGGQDPDGDIDRLQQVRNKLGASIELWLDPNQGYSVDAALKVARALEGTIALLEQPTSRDDPQALVAVAKGTAVPVYADESVLEPLEALRLAESVQGINIKVQKLGGLIEARRVTGICTAAGIEALVGCMDECSLGIAGGLTLALAFPAIVRADLDGHLDLQDDPTRGAVEIEGGVLRPSGSPGLGLPFDLDPA